MNDSTKKHVQKLLRVMPDELYLKAFFRFRLHKKLNLDNPLTFNEKLQWLKLYDRRPEYTMMVDKYEAKKYVSSIIGSEYIIPTLGIWDDFRDISFDKLPRQFVLKCTHDSGGLVICRDKKTFDIDKAQKKIKGSLNNNYYYYGREWPYKNVKPRIIAEKYMEDCSAKSLIDYKFYCFNGIPKFLYVSAGLEDHLTAQISYATLDWKIAPYKRTDYRPFDKLPPKPVNFEQMKYFAELLSEDIPFSRIDFYEINQKLYFGEITLFPGSGYAPFDPPEWDKIIGEWITLHKKNS